MSAVTLTKRPLAANESFTQDMRDRFNDKSPIGAVRALVYADKTGTLYLEESDNEGTTWSQTATLSVSVGTTGVPWTDLTKRWYRFRYVNDVVAQTKFVLIQQSRGMDLSDVATEAKQDALNALIGEAQASPTANTLLARIKNIEDKIDAITAGITPAITQLAGSKVCLSTDPKPVGVSGDTLLEYNVTTKESKVYKHISGDWREL